VEVARAIDLYRALGGTVGCRKLSQAFYARVGRDPVLCPLFPGKSLRCATEEFAAFLVQFAGGPAEDTQYRWWVSLRESHLRFKIGARERDAWMNNMQAALEESGFSGPVHDALRDLFEQSSAYVVNVGEAPAPADDGCNDEIRREVRQRWDVQLALDRAVAAVRSGDSAEAIGLIEAAAPENPSVTVALLAAMLKSGDPALLEYACERVRSDPRLIGERFNGRTLLHIAAGAGVISMVQLLLRLGCDPNVIDSGGHTALYHLANECRSQESARVATALIQAHANINACDGVKRCTPLHMAARRGSVEVAAALLDAGAAIEAKDTSGDTPLRRAVNCGKGAVVELLIARGADVQSIGRKGLTPLQAARSGEMKRLLQSVER